MKEREDAWGKVTTLAKDNPYYNQVGDSLWLITNILHDANEIDDSDVLGLAARRAQDINF